MRILAVLCLVAGLSGAQVRPAQSPDGNLPAMPIGRNDLLAIDVYGAPEFSRSLRVSSQGEIRLPMLEQRVKAEGRMPADLESAIAEALETEGVLVSPVVTVTVVEYNSRPVSVAGAVRSPITFQAIGRLTLLEAIARAGGLDKTAGTEILVAGAPTNGSNPPEVKRISVKRLFETADPESNLVLEGGEEIRVPEAGRIFVVGNVKKPGAFQDAGEATVMKAIALAEGTLPFSSKQAFVYRPDATGAKQEIAVELRNIIDRKSPDVELLANDILYIPDNRGRRLGAAAIQRILLFGSTAGATALIYGSR
jgi:polysaccharide export outer membrane protein